MPLYEYECNACKKRFELRQKVTEDPVSICPSCGGTVRRLIYPVGIIFKGSGFYVTDNRKGDVPSSTTGTGDVPAASKTENGAKTDAGAKSDAPKSDSSAKADGASPGGKSTSSAEPASRPATSTSSSASKE
jgi:putative FmdB family regulatory protein